MPGTLRALEKILAGVSERNDKRFVKTLLKAPRVFVYGLGRSGLVARMFGMRLVHLGRDATIVGDTTTPAIRADDLLVVCSRSGKSPFLHHAMQLAREEGATVCALTGARKNPISADADFCVRLPIELAQNDRHPMGTLFEQALLLYLDGVVLELMASLSKTAEDMERIHSNLP